MPLAPGTHLGPFEILAPIGAGGMGEVYRAKDTKLKREVALKVLPDSFAGDRNRMARFQREAEMLASLNHRNIAQIYGVEDGALVMELVEGGTLSSPLPIETALNYARQIAEALEYAHERGVIHRDLKPANIKVTPDGTVKLLDFGLAKAIEDPTASRDDPEHSPTLTLGVTRIGVILGTAAYMSPEQASGKTADRRADIWGFGAVLYEMLSGKRAFAGESVSETLASVLKVDPDWKALPKETPASIRRLIQRCLTKDRKQRLQAIGEARIAIDAALAGGTPLLEDAPDHGSARRPWGPWGVAAVLAVGLGPVAFVHFREKAPTPAAPLRFQLELPGATSPLWPFLSPDGRKLAFVAGDRLKVHFLDTGELRDLTHWEGTPIWSPDSRFLAYPFENKIRKIEVTGGPSETVADYKGVWGAGAWSKDDVIVFGAIPDAHTAVPGGLFRVPASGGAPVQITAYDPARKEQSHFGPSFLPDGRHFVYIRASTDPERSAIYLGSVDAKPERQSSKPLVFSHYSPWYAPSADPNAGFLLFIRDGTLMAQRFDNRRLELTGQATAIAGQVAEAGSAGYGPFSASSNDALVFGQSTSSIRQLTWYDREGKVLGTVWEPGDYAGLALSPDGTRLAFGKNNRSTLSSNIWLLDLSRGTSTRFTFGSAKDSQPVWSPDGSRIIFSSNRDGPYNLYQKLVSGVKDEEVLLKSSEDKSPDSWSRDGHFLLYSALNAKTKYDSWVLPLEGDRKPVPFLITEFQEGLARFSPDGRWVAYTSDETGTYEVYVRSFSMNSGGTATQSSGKWQISNGSGLDPHWRGDGRELYYRSVEGRVMAVEIVTHPEFRSGKPQPLGPQAPLENAPAMWDSTADGKRFLLAQVTKPGPEQYTVVLNWQAELKK